MSPQESEARVSRGALEPTRPAGGAGLSHRALRVTWAAGNRGRPCLPRPAPRPRPGQGLDCARSPAESRGGACCGPCVRGPRVTCPWAVCPLVACPHPPVFSGPRRTTQETREEVRASARHQCVQERGPSLAAGRHDLWPHAGRGSASPPLQCPAGVTDAAPAPAAPAAVICAPSRRRSHPRPLPGRTPQPGLAGAWSGGWALGSRLWSHCRPCGALGCRMSVVASANLPVNIVETDGEGRGTPGGFCGCLTHGRLWVTPNCRENTVGILCPVRTVWRGPS